MVTGLRWTWSSAHALRVKRPRGSITTLYGLSPERLEELIKSAVGDAIGPPKEDIDDLSKRLKVTESAATAMLRIIGEHDVPIEQLADKLEWVANQYKSAKAQLAALEPQDPTARDLATQAKEAWDTDKFDEADRLVSEAEQAEFAAAQQNSRTGERSSSCCRPTLVERGSTPRNAR